ncbi:MAG: DUF2071 domain-containing protein [Planctomyces sp.]
MSLAAISGVIERRILANYRIEPEAVRRFLPAPFQPKLFAGFAIGGICLIRLGRMRPAWFPVSWGLGSENAAHRIAVEWREGEAVREGVYIPRRHTNSRLNVLAGGLVFPVVQQLARFEVRESQERLSVNVGSASDGTSIHVSGRVSAEWTGGSVFSDLQTASDFFRGGALGYSAAAGGGHLSGIELNCEKWQVETLAVERMESSFFEDLSVFPRGTVQVDCALLMRGIGHRWDNRGVLCCG